MLVYLRRNNKPFCYLRLAASEIFNQWSNEYKTYSLKVDRSCVAEEDFQDYRAGYLRARFTMFTGQGNINEWIPPSKSDAKTQVGILVNLIRAIDLPSGDENGLSDPFVEMEHYSRARMSTVCPKTLDPIWNQRILLDTYCINDQIMPLLLTVFDSDSDDPKKLQYEFLGRKIIQVPSVICSEGNINVVPKLEWHELEYSETLQIGKILLSIQLVPITVSPERIIPLAYNRTGYRMKFRLLGLRKYSSSGIFPIKKPYIKINLAACRGELASSSSLDMLTANSKSGNSEANFSEVIKYAKLTKHVAESVRATRSAAHCFGMIS